MESLYAQFQEEREIHTEQIKKNLARIEKVAYEKIEQLAKVNAHLGKNGNWKSD